MDQIPATPKLKRLRLKAITRLGFARPNAAGLAASEAAALRLRNARRGETWTRPDHITFLIPLVGPGSVRNWGKVTELLAYTLRSLIIQSNENWRAIVCCQEKPPLTADIRISHLPFDDPTPGNDKWRKLQKLYEYLAKTETSAGLAMTFDGDDRAAPTLVEQLLNAPSGALLTHGFVYDAAHKRLALARPQSLREPGAKAFWKLCGSCLALPFDPAAPSSKEQMSFLHDMSQHEHRMGPYLASLSGTHLTKMADPQALYLLNQGENFGERRGRVSFKTRFVKRFEIKDPEVRNFVEEIYRV